MGKEQIDQTFNKLVAAITSLGYPEEFGTLIAMSLGTEKTMSRMTAYIYKSRPQSAEEIADEMLSIKAEFAKYREKKIAEYYNGKLNQLMAEGLEPDCEKPPKDAEPESEI